MTTARTNTRTKLTLRLPNDLVRTAQEAVTLGLAPSTSAFIEDSVRARAREVRQARLRRLADEAMADPAFVADMRTTAAFAPALTDQWSAESAETGL
jgi:Arc/MetJ-type ribon-helix-helix transcriptional regulator